MPHSRGVQDENESGIVCSEFWLCLGPPAQSSSRRFKFLGALLKPRFFICKVQSLWMSLEHEIQAPGTRLKLTQAIWILCHLFCKAKSAKTKGCRSKSCSLQATNAPQNNDLTFEGKRLMTTSSCSHPCFPPWLERNQWKDSSNLACSIYIQFSETCVFHYLCGKLKTWKVQQLNRLWRPLCAQTSWNNTLHACIHIIFQCPCKMNNMGYRNLSPFGCSNWWTNT